LYGNPLLDDTGAVAVRTVLKATGADQAVERMITKRCEQALASLERLPIPRHVHHQLHHLTEHAGRRTA
jgi:geranylgeranyl diphosphate synthase, type I